MNHEIKYFTQGARRHIVINIFNLYMLQFMFKSFKILIKHIIVSITRVI